MKQTALQLWAWPAVTRFPIYTSLPIIHCRRRTFTNEAPSASELAELPRPRGPAAESTRRRPTERRIHLRPSLRNGRRGEVSDVLGAAPVL